MLTEQLDAIIDELRTRPVEEPVMTALRNAVVEVLRVFEADEPCDTSRYHQLQDLIADSPALRAAASERSAARLTQMAGLLGQRMGVDPATDPRPGFIAAISLCATPPAVDARREHEPVRPVSELYGELFDLLGTGMNYPAATPGREQP